MGISKCLQGAVAGVGVSAMLEGVGIAISGSFPPVGIAVGGLVAGAVLGCIIDSYLSGNQINPVVSTAIADIIDEDEANFNATARTLVDVYDQIITYVNNFQSTIANGVKYDLLWIMVETWDSYYEYISAVQNYKAYLIDQFNQGINPLIQNFLYTASAYGTTLGLLSNIGSIYFSVFAGNYA